jgi:hypothetical protein
MSCNWPSILIRTGLPADTKMSEACLRIIMSKYGVKSMRVVSVLSAGRRS